MERCTGVLRGILEAKMIRQCRGERVWMEKITIVKHPTGVVSADVNAVSSEAAVGMMGRAIVLIAEDTAKGTRETRDEAKKRLARLVLMGMHLEPEDLL